MDDMKSRQPDKVRRSMIIQIASPIVLTAVILIIINILFLRIVSLVYSLFEQYKILDRLALSAVEEMKSYKSIDWLLDYWWENADGMDLIYSNNERFISKNRLFREHHPEVTELIYVTDEEAVSYTPEDQKLFAELCYSLLSGDYDRLKRSQNCVFLYSFSIRNDEMFILATGTTENEKRISEGGDLYELGVITEYRRGAYSMLDTIVDTGKGVSFPEMSVGEGADSRIMHAFEPIVIDGKLHAIVGVAEYNEVVVNMSRVQTYVIVITTAVLLAIMIFVVVFRVRKVVIRPIKWEQKVISEYEQNKDSKATVQKLGMVKSRNEIQTMAENFSSMITELDRYMDEVRTVTAEKERIGAELNVATKIQADMLPSVFPPFPDRKEFDIYASMTPAKEVGGDFYDFFLIDEDHLALVMADVSGKGVPAALFMVISKTLIKNRTQFGDFAPGKILSEVSDRLCEGNTSQLFVTVWLGILTISTGHMVCANAGHESPAIRKRGGQFELFKDKHGVPLAAMEGMHYREYELVFEPGDILFEYTDGVTEATDLQNGLFGKERLLEALNKSTAGNDMKKQDEDVKSAIAGFVDGASQFDDITMLGFVYYGTDRKETEEKDE
ncbi:MAG: PP2C family protein-serine/threonine phosphatase [Lachnospiraceae bacterium]|nr:PP2C family protein-serine/threonine phosphatase [Lachnospiraceae bacterium]